jgi:hypothetical protein
VKLKTNIEKLETQVEEYINHERSAAERVGAAALALVTVFSMTSLGREDMSRLRAVVLPAVAFSIVIDHALAGESEVERMPVTLDKGIQTPTTSGG